MHVYCRDPSSSAEALLAGGSGQLSQMEDRANTLVYQQTLIEIRTQVTLDLLEEQDDDDEEEVRRAK